MRFGRIARLLELATTEAPLTIEAAGLVAR